MDGSRAHLRMSATGRDGWETVHPWRKPCRRLAARLDSGKRGMDRVLRRKVADGTDAASSTERGAGPTAVDALAHELRDRLALEEEPEIVAAAGLGVRAAHVEPPEGVDPHQRARAFTVQVQGPHEELPL